MTLVFKALGEETKYSILKELTKGERCACELPLLINKSQSNTSMHLLKLKEWELIKNRREGKKIIYSLKEDKVKKVLKVIEE